MSLSNVILMRLNASSPIKERCQFAKDLCSNHAIALSNKETLLINWVSQHLTKEDCGEVLEVWVTLRFVLELSSKKDIGKSPILKTSFINVILNHVSHLSKNPGADKEQLSTEIVKCISALLLNQATRQNVIKQPTVLLKILTSFLGIINSFLDRGVTSKILIYEYNLLLKRVFESRMLNCESIFSTVVRNTVGTFLKYSELIQSIDDTSATEVSVSLTNWLKSVLCNLNLNQSYKQVLELEEVDNKRSSIKSVETLMKFIKSNLKSDNSLSRISTGRLMSLILNGMLEKQLPNSLDLPFSILTYFSNLITTDNSEESLAILNQLLEVCARNSTLLNRNGKITTAVKLNWFKEKCSAVLKLEEQAHLEMLKFLTLLLKINSSILDHQLEKVWEVTWLNFSPENSEKQTEFLCLLLKTYSRLNQLPKLFSKFLECLTKLSVQPTNGNNFPKLFVVNFAECVVSLPAGQSLDLWRTLLDGCQFSYLKMTWKIPALVEMLSTLLLHVKLTDEFPSSKQNQLLELLNNTTQFLQTTLKTPSVNTKNILYLSYAWGEVILTLNLYCEGDFVSKLKPDTPYASDLLDISPLHHYLSLQEWKSCLKEALTFDGGSHNFVELLLIQKARFFSIMYTSDRNEVQSVLSQVSTFIFSNLYSRFQPETLKSTDVSYNCWDRTISWFPLLLKMLDSKQLVKFCLPAVRTILVEEWKSENNLTNALMKNNFFLESRSLQTALLTCIWNEAANVLICLKRKSGEDSQTESQLVWKYLSKNPKIWQEFSETMPGALNEPENEMWQMTSKAAATFLDQSAINKAVNVETALRIVQTLCFFPLEDMELGNRFRCTVGFLQLLWVLKGTNHSQKTELHVLICQSLVRLLSKTKSSTLALFFDANILLQKMFELLKTSLNSEEQKWSLVLLDNIAHIFINNTESLIKIETFTNQLNGQNGSCVLEIKVLQSLIKRLDTRLKRYSSLNHVQSFQNCDKLSWFLVDSLSNHVLAKSELDDKLIWQSLTCIINYHCREVPSHLQIVKRKPKKILKQHVGMIEKLVLPKEFSDEETKGNFYELLEVICKNMLMFEKYLPDNFMLSIWDIILRNMIGSFNMMNANSRKEMLGVASVVQSMTTTELEDAMKQLNKFCDNVISNSNAFDIVKLIPLWTTVIGVDFSVETPSCVRNALERFFNSVLPLLLQPLTSSERISQVVLPVLEFVSCVLQKHKMPLKHSQAVMCFQTCSSLKLTSSEPKSVISLCSILITIYKRLLTRTSKIILQSVAPFLCSLSAILKQLVWTGNRSLFQRYDEGLRKLLMLCAEDFSKLLGLIFQHKKEFCKQAAFLIADYIQEVQNITLDPLMKEQILLGIYKLLDLSGEHVIAMLQVSLPPGGREILKQLRADFDQYYRYKGKV